METQIFKVEVVSHSRSTAKTAWSGTRLKEQGLLINASSYPIIFEFRLIVHRALPCPHRGRTPLCPGRRCPLHTGTPSPWDPHYSPRCPGVWSSPSGSVHSETPDCQSSWIAGPLWLRWNWTPSKTHMSTEGVKVVKHLVTFSCQKTLTCILRQ